MSVTTTVENVKMCGLQGKFNKEHEIVVDLSHQLLGISREINQKEKQSAFSFFFFQDARVSFLSTY